MATGDIKYSTSSSLATIMSTQLNSLADGAINVGGDSDLDNTTNEHHNLMAELYLASVDLSAQDSPAVELYLVPKIDGTNFCDTGTDASTTDLPPGSAHIGTFYIQETSAAHRAAISCKNCLQDLEYRAVLLNKTGAAFAASGNTLKIKTNSDQVSA